MTILPRINDIPAFGFAETVTRDDGSVQRSGALEFRSPYMDQLRAELEKGGPLTYAGPVCVDGAWIEQSFTVTMTPSAPTSDACVRFSIIECVAAPAAALIERSDVAA